MEQETNTPVAPTKGRKFINIAITVVIVVVLFALLGNGKWKKSSEGDSSGLSNQTELPDGCKPGYLFSETTGKPCPAPSDDESLTTASEQAPSGFETAIRMYSGKTFLLDGACTTYPQTATFAPGTRVLVANNSAAKLTVALGDKKEELDGYHYFTTAFKTAGTYKLSCNGVDKAVITVK